jgi:hypothetical protein
LVVSGFMKKLLWLLLFFSTHSFACSCVIPAYPSKKDYLYNFEHSDAVFTGTVISVSAINSNITNDNQIQRVTVRTAETFKGSVLSERFFTIGGVCGSSSFTPGKTYLIYATADKSGVLYVSGCSFTKEFKAKSREHKILRKASNYAIKPTSVGTLFQSFTSRASAPYFGC